MKVSIGFTGTQHGMTPLQTRTFINLIEGYEDTEPENYFHHGCCVGCDEEAAALAKELGFVVIGHPGYNARKSSAVTKFDDDTRHPLPFLDRNKVIVTSCDFLIACPFTVDEKVRSGTWATIRFARKLEVQTFIICPDGSVREENG